MIAPTLDCGGGGDCPDGQECLPDDYVAPCADGEECLPDNYIDPADCPSQPCTLEPTAYVHTSTGTGASSFTTGNFTPDDGTTLVVIASLQTTGDFGDHSGEITIDDSVGLAWTRGGHVCNGAEQSFAAMMAVFTAEVATGVSMNVTLAGFGFLTAIVHIVGVKNTTGGAVVVGTTTLKDDLALSGPDAITIPAPALNSIMVASRATGHGNLNPIEAISDAASVQVLTDSLDGSQGLQTEWRLSDTSTSIGWDDVCSPGGTGYAPAALAIELLCSPCPVCACEGTYIPYCLGPENAVDADTLILSTSPFAYYLMDATGALDISGNGNNGLSSIGTVNYGVAGITSKNSSGEATQYLNGGSIAFPPPVADMEAPGTAWALCLVLQVDAYNSGAGGNPAIGGGFPFISWAGTSPPKMAHGFSSTGQLAPWSDSNFSRLGNYQMSEQVLFALGEPHVLIINGRTDAGVGVAEFWLDGVLLMSNPRSGDGTDGASFQIGRIAGGGPYFGAIDATYSNFATWSRQLTQAEIEDISAALIDDAILATSWIPA